MKKIITFIFASMVMTSCFNTKQTVQIENILNVEGVDIEGVDGTLYNAAALFFNDGDELVGSVGFNDIKPFTTSKKVDAPNRASYFIVKWRATPETNAILYELEFYTAEKRYLSESGNTKMTISRTTQTKTK